MKKILIIAVLTGLVYSCCKNTTQQKATVVRNCTGLYLRINEKNYQVCNEDKVPYPADVSVTVRFRKITECNGSANDKPRCMMLFPSEGWIEVCEIKNY